MEKPTKKRTNKPEINRKSYSTFMSKNKENRVLISFYDREIKAKKELLKPENMTEREFYKACLEAYEKPLK